MFGAFVPVMVVAIGAILLRVLWWMLEDVILATVDLPVASRSGDLRRRGRHV
jgi:hypothetical protein